MASNEGASSSSAPRTPTDSFGEPLPVPTTLTTHIRGPRLLRSASRSSRGSRSSSNAGSRNSSRTPQQEIIEPVQAEPATSGSEGLLRAEKPSGSDLSIGAENSGLPVAQSHAGGEWEQELAQLSRKRRRAYSIHDEMDPEREVPVQLSTFDYSANILSEESLDPVVPSKRTITTQRTTKRRKVRNADTSEAGAGPSTRLQFSSSEPDVEIIRLPGESTVEESALCTVVSGSSSVAATTVAPPVPSVSASEPLAEYACPICFSPPTNATITPCGHICCGECLFTAVRSALHRAPAVMAFREPVVARCPVCRATLDGWDGRGGGVIGLKPRTVISL